MLEKIFAAVIVAGCLVMLLRLGLRPRRRQGFDSMIGRWRRHTSARLRSIFTWGSSHRRAQRVAEAAIRRAREGTRTGAGEWEGNVYRPKSFKKKGRKTH